MKINLLNLSRDEIASIINAANEAGNCCTVKDGILTIMEPPADPILPKMERKARHLAGKLGKFLSSLNDE